LKKVIALLVTVATAIFMVGASFSAYYSDIDTINHEDQSLRKIELSSDARTHQEAHTDFTNLAPGFQPLKKFEIKNTGLNGGYLEIERIHVGDFENECQSSEIASGDITCGGAEGNGELSQLLSTRILVDANCDGWYQNSDRIIWEGYFNAIPSNLDIDEQLDAGSLKCINFLVQWQNSSGDSLGQSDSMTLDMDFELRNKMVRNP
jgi:hypothetical protein